MMFGDVLKWNQNDSDHIWRCQNKMIFQFFVTTLWKICERFEGKFQNFSRRFPKEIIIFQNMEI